MVRIPDIELTWWNVETKELETRTLLGRELQVRPASEPEPGSTAAAARSGQDRGADACRIRR